MFTVSFPAGRRQWILGDNHSPIMGLPLSLMPDQKALKREETLRLLAESDSELAKILRLLELHPSFWDRKTGFLQWQFLRRQPRYRQRIAALYKKEPSLYNRRNAYLKNYPPGIGDRFSQWERGVRNPNPAGLS